MTRERVCIVQSDHPFPKCNCDAIADIPATHFPCASARELSSAAQKGICWQENNVCSVVWTYSRRATYPGTDLSRRRLRPGQRGSPHLPPSSHVGHLSGQETRAPRRSCLQLALRLCVGSASSTHLRLGWGKENKEKKKRM